MTQTNATEKIAETFEANTAYRPLTKRQHDTLEYLRTMIGQLSAMADGEQAHIISYMLGMAYIETSEILRGTRPLSCQCQSPLPDVENKALQAIAEAKISQFRRTG